MKQCECGCGNKVKNEKNRFINGHSCKGKNKSEEHKRKIGEAQKGRQFSEEHKRKISNALKGRKQSEEHKSKLSTIRKGKPTWNKGKKMSQEWKNRVRQNFLGKNHTSDTKKQMRKSTIKRIEQQFLNGEPLTPCIGEKEREFLDEIQNILDLKVIRQFPVCGYFIDGYIPDIKLALEFDELHNHKNVSKDKKRQKEIVKKLNCHFFRVTDLEWKNNKKEVINNIGDFKMT